MRCRTNLTTALEEKGASEQDFDHGSCALKDSNRALARQCDEIRKNIGMSIAEHAKRIDVDRKRLWYVLGGKREMRADEFLKICVALRIDPRRFITRDMVDDVRKRILNR